MRKRIFKNSILALVASAFFMQQAHAAQCEYSIINDWGSGFQGEIRITNTDATPVNGWAVAWEYTDGSRINHSWNATLTGTNPYSASPLRWNTTIHSGQSVAIGFTGTKGQGTAVIPVISGEVCGALSSSSASVASSVATSASSVSSLSSTSSSVSSVVSSSSSSSSSSPIFSSSSSSTVSSVIASSSSAANTALWRLDAAASQLNFTTTKKIHIMENMRFTRLAGDVLDNGLATLVIDLTSIDSGIEVRDGRMQNLLFETSLFSTATVTLPVDTNALSALAVGESTILSITAELDLHGVINDITTQIKISRLSDSAMMVQNVAPLLIVADDYDLEGGVEALRTVANLSSIGKVVPVDFTLTYTAL